MLGDEVTMNYSKELAGEICQRIAEGETLRTICCDSDMPDRSSIREWRLKNKEFSAQYALSVESRTEVMFDDILSIADNVAHDKNAINQARLSIDSRKWYLSKVLPKIQTNGSYTEQMNQILEYQKEHNMTSEILLSLMEVVKGKAEIECGTDFKKRMIEVIESYEANKTGRNVLS